MIAWTVGMGGSHAGVQELSRIMNVLVVGLF
jgi:hypothetical protein